MRIRLLAALIASVPWAPALTFANVTVNDVPTTTEEIKAAVKANPGSISMGGGRYRVLAVTCSKKMWKTENQVAKRKCMMSPSFTTYSLPSNRKHPASLTAASLLNFIRSSKLKTSALMKPFSKSV